MKTKKKEELEMKLKILRSGWTEISKEVEIFEKQGLLFGRIISPSKTTYLELHPGNMVIFNSRVYDLKTFQKHKDGKIKDFFEGMELEIWYGDLDLNIDIATLATIARKIGPIVITKESGGPIITIWG